jgi:hypothetical protein
LSSIRLDKLIKVAVGSFIKDQNWPNCWPIRIYILADSFDSDDIVMMTSAVLPRTDSYYINRQGSDYSISETPQNFGVSDV